MRNRIIAIAAAAGFGAAIISAASLEGARDVRPEGEAATAHASEGLERTGGRTTAPDGSRGVRLSVPEHGPLLRAPTPHVPAEVPPRRVRAHAYQYVSRVFERPRERPTAIGFVRRGTVLRADERVPGAGCDGGAWYRLQGAPGFVCSRDGFALSREVLPPVQRQPLPDVAAALPFTYGKAKTKDALRFVRIPTEVEEAEIASALALDQRLPDVVSDRLDGVYLLALDRVEQRGERAFHRTVRGRYVRVEDVEPKPLPPMRGELLGGDRTLPLAFVYGEDDAPLYRRGAAGPEVVGSAARHARFAVTEQTRWGDIDVVVGSDGLAAPRERVRIASTIPPPAEVGPGDKWIHVNLDEQVLVAYEGREPVFTTLVSSGKGAEFATPTGLFRIREKHLSATMRGPDPDHGYYEVEEVPWTLYYYDSYALHGAYWHDEFGNTRSHGCTNISPVDARWLFYWSDDELPPGFHALRKLHGTWVYLTRELAPQ